MISMYGKKSVANSTGEIIPFVYWDNDLDPTYRPHLRSPCGFSKSSWSYQSSPPYANEDLLDYIELQQAFSTVMEMIPLNRVGLTTNMNLGDLLLFINR